MDSIDPLDDIVHQRVRLGILAILSETRQADFSYLKSKLQVTDGNLGQHIKILAVSGLVIVSKDHDDRRRRTWITMTRAGDAALAAEITTLTSLLGL